MTKKEKQRLQAIKEEQTRIGRFDRMPIEHAREMCRCTHERGYHFDAAWGLAKGHGTCGVAHCSCTKFTWVAPAQ